MFSVQFSVFSRGRERAGAAGNLLPVWKRQWRTSRQWFPQVSTNWSTQDGWVWMGPNWEKSSAQLSTIRHMPTQANTIPAHAGTSASMPAHSCTTVEPPSSTRKPLRKRYLHRWIRFSFAFRGGRHAGLGCVGKGLQSNDLRTGASLPRRPAFREKHLLTHKTSRRKGGSKDAGNQECRVGSSEARPLFGRTCGAILFRAEVWEVNRAEGRAVHP